MTTPEEIEVARRNLLAELKAALADWTVEPQLDQQTVRDLVEVLEASAPADRAEHLTATASERGFDRYPVIPGAYGGEAEVYESSAASAPHVWLKATESPLHLAAENAKKLGEQLLAAVANHYQNEGDS